MKTEDDVILNNNFIMNKLLVEAESENYFVSSIVLCKGNSWP